MLAYDSQRRIQPQTGPFPYSLGSEERFEDARLNVRRDPRPRISNLDHGTVSFQKGFDSQFTLPVHGIDGVVDDVGPYLVELAAIGVNQQRCGMVIALDGYGFFQLVGHDGQSILQAFGQVDVLHQCLVHVRVLFNSADQVGDLGGTVLQLGKQVVDLNQRRHAFQRRLSHLASHPAEHDIQRDGVNAGFHQRRRILPAILDSMLMQNRLDLVLKRACLQHVGLRRFYAARGFECLDGRPLALGELDRLQLVGRASKLSYRIPQSFGSAPGRSRGIVQLVGKACRKLAQRCQSIALLLASRGFAGPVHHGRHQAPTQFGQVAEQVVELGSQKYQNSRWLDCPAGAGKDLHSRVGQHAGNGSSMGGKHVLVCSLKSRLQLAFQDHNHFVRNIARANINIAGLHADLGCVFEEPVQLLVRKIVEDFHGAKFFSGDVRHRLYLRHITVDELHRNRSLAYRRGNSLDGTVPYVTHYKHTGYAALQQKRIAVEQPLRRKLSVLQQVWPRQNKSPLIAGNSPLQPVRPGQCTDVDVHGAGRHSFQRIGVGTLHRNLLQVRLSVNLDDRRVRPHLNIGCLLNLVDEVARHGCRERVTPNQHHHLLCVPVSYTHLRAHETVLDLV